MFVIMSVIMCVCVCVYGRLEGLSLLTGLESTFADTEGENFVLDN